MMVTLHTIVTIWDCMINDNDTIFTHDQLYVILSIVKSTKWLKLLILDNDGRLTNKSFNVVYKEAFRKI